MALLAPLLYICLKQSALLTIYPVNVYEYLLLRRVVEKGNGRCAPSNTRDGERGTILNGK